MPIPQPTQVTGQNLYVDYIHADTLALERSVLLDPFGNPALDTDIFDCAEFAGRDHWSINSMAQLNHYRFDGFAAVARRRPITPVVAGNPDTETPTSISGLTWNGRDFFLLVNTGSGSGGVDGVNQFQMDDQSTGFPALFPRKVWAMTGDEGKSGMAYNRDTEFGNLQEWDGRDFFIGNASQVEQWAIEDDKSEAMQNLKNYSLQATVSEIGYNGRNFLMVEQSAGGYKMDMVEPITMKSVVQVSHGHTNWQNLVDASWDGKSWLVYYALFIP